MAATAFGQTQEPCGSSPSLLDNNFTASEKLGAFASKNKVVFLHTEQSRAFAGPQLGGSIFYLRYLKLLSGDYVLCVGFSGGTQVYSEDGSYLLHLVSLDSPSLPPPAADQNPSHRCATALVPAPNREVLAFGDYRGVVHLLEYRSAGNSFSTLADCIVPGPGGGAGGGGAGPGEGVGITCLECVNYVHGFAQNGAMASGEGLLPSELVVGHEDGTLNWYQVTQTATGEDISYTHLHQDSFDDVPTQICATGSGDASRVPAFTTVSFGTGRLIVYSNGTRERFAEIAAHAKWVTGLSYNPRQELLVSVGEDTVCNVWKISEETGISLIHSSVVDTKLLTGCAWTTQTEFGVTAYDSENYFRLKL